jgi:hypothetical protein
VARAGGRQWPPAPPGRSTPSRRPYGRPPGDRLTARGRGRRPASPATARHLAEHLHQALGCSHIAVGGLIHTNAFYQPELEPLPLQIRPALEQ